jgi:hypothetical protein
MNPAKKMFFIAVAACILSNLLVYVVLKISP